MIALLRSIREARRAHGSLERLFLSGDAEGGGLTAALSSFVRTLRALGRARFQAGETAIRKNLLPDPADGSACKRLFLFLRWMVRKDDIDPGGLGIPVTIQADRSPRCSHGKDLPGQTRISRRGAGIGLAQLEGCPRGDGSFYALLSR